MKAISYILIVALILIGCETSLFNRRDDLIKTMAKNTSITSTDISHQIFTKSSFDCTDYDGSYNSNVKDLKNSKDFSGNLTVIADKTACSLTSNNIPNHDFNDETAHFATNVSERHKSFSIPRHPQPAARNSGLTHHAWDAVLLNGVVVDLLSAGCYKPNSWRADSEGNIQAGCSEDDNWLLVPLETTHKFGADQHNAHVQPDGSYHYHGNPKAMFDTSPSGKGSPVIGFAADGFPIYGEYILDSNTGQFRKVLSGYALKKGSRGTKSGSNPGGTYTGLYEQDWEWTGSGDLDECNGMSRDGQYGYYVTSSYPYILACHKGIPDPSFSKRRN